MTDRQGIVELWQSYGLGGQWFFAPESPLSDAELERLSDELKPYRLERDSHGHIVVMSPTSTRYSTVTSQLNAQLGAWAQEDGSGVVYSSDAGFTLPDGSMRSPDAAWLLRSRWQALTAQDQDGFARICPDFIVEVRSPSDTIKSQQSKMEMWLSNGARLGWLIDPVDETNWIYRPGATPEVLLGFDRKLSGEGVLSGFELDLGRMRVV